MPLGMAGAFEKVGVQAVVDGFKPYMAQLGQMEAKTKGFGSKIGSALKKGALIGGAALLGLGAIAVKLGNDFVNLASDYEESLSKTRIVFGESAKAVEAFAKTAATSLGMAEGKTLEATATFGNFLTAMGQAPEEAAKLSINMVTLAGDMASFNNASPEEVLLALRSGLSGEAEPLKRFGIALNETTMKAKATELGLTGVNGVLTEGEKIQARYALIMEQTGTAQGDFARTSEGLANKQRILAAQMEDLKVKIGRKLLPVKLALANFVMKKVIPAMTKLFETIDKKVVPVLKRDLIPRIKDIVRALVKFFVPALDTLRDAWVNVGRPIAKLVLPILKKVGSFLLEHKPLLIAIAAAILLLVAPWLAVAAAIAVVLAKWDEISAFFIGIGKAIQKFIKDAIKWVSDFPIIGEIVKDTVRTAKIYVDTQLKIIQALFQAAVDTITNIFKFWKAIFTGDWEGAWNALKDQAKVIWTLLSSLFGIALDAVKAIFSSKLTMIKGIGSDLGHLIVDAASKIWIDLKRQFGDSVNAIGTWVTENWGRIKGFGASVVKAVGEGMRSAIGWARGALNALITVIERGVNFIIKLINAIPDVKLPFGLGSIGIPNIGYVSVPRLHRGAFEIPQDMLARLQAGEMVLPRPQAEVVREAVLAPSVAPQAAAAMGGGVDPQALAAAVASALQGMTVTMDGRVVGNLVSERLGSQSSMLGRGG